jgi:hypothetical protein
LTAEPLREENRKRWPARSPETFVGNGLWVTFLSDPDGYKLEFASPTDVPEGRKLS